MSDTAWTPDEWDLFCVLLSEAWPRDFGDATRDAWRLLLDSTPPQTALTGLRRLLHEGRKWRPSASEILEAARRDPTRPTFPEALRLLYGRRGALTARGPDRYGDEAERRRGQAEAVRERCETLHPLIGSFVARQGIERLQGLRLNDPEHGELRRRDLERAWDQHVEAMDGRDIAVLASGDRRGELGRMDPLAALPGPVRARLAEKAPQ